MEVNIYNNSNCYRKSSLIISSLCTGGNMCYIVYKMPALFHINIMSEYFSYFIITYLFSILIQFYFDVFKFVMKHTTKQIESIICYFKYIHIFNIIYLIVHYISYNNKLNNTSNNTEEYYEYNTLRNFCLITMIIYIIHNFLKYILYCCAFCDIFINFNMITHNNNNNDDYEYEQNNENINIYINNNTESSNINSLNVINYSRLDNNLDDTCIICLDDYNDNNNIGTLYCNHYFHQECIDQWFQKVKVCPICRLGE